MMRSWTLLLLSPALVLFSLTSVEAQGKSGDKIPDQDPDNEEYSDKQMNFGFTFGDEGIPEPYFYVTAYPSPDAFSALKLPDGTDWKSEGFTGAVLTYRRLLEEADPTEYLLRLWNQLLEVGKQQLIDHSK